MAPSSLPSSSPNDDATMTRVVRRHAHDVRNHLNGIELGATLIGELAGGDPDISDTVSQIQKQLMEMESALKSLVAKFSLPRAGRMAASELLERWKSRLAPDLEPGQTVEWPDGSDLNTFFLSADQEILPAVLCGISLAAVKRAPCHHVRVKASAVEGNLVLELREAEGKSPPPAEAMEENAWLIRRHGGEWSFLPAENPGEWVTRLIFPAASPADTAAG